MNLLSQEDPGGPIDISPLRLAFAVVPLVAVALLSLRLRLHLHNKLAIGAIRCASQLSLLGWILVPIFTTNLWWMTLGYCLIMILVASAEAVSRPQHTYSWEFMAVFFSIGVTCAAVISFGLIIVIGVSPWYEPQYLIPLLGMLLGNACSSVSVGLTSILREFAQGRDGIELLLSLGATRMEATRDVVYTSLRLAMTPLINTMNVVGIVSIPGMMTGQILGGSDPAVAARYQIIIFFLVAVSSSVSSIMTVYMTVFCLCDNRHRLEPATQLVSTKSRKSLSSRISGLFHKKRHTSQQEGDASESVTHREEEEEEEEANLTSPLLPGAREQQQQQQQIGRKSRD